MMHSLSFALILLASATSACTTAPAPASTLVSAPAGSESDTSAGAPAPVDAPSALPPASQASADCYNYLTEMFRSSNFPFGSATPQRLNLLIDEDAGGTIRARVVDKTETLLFTGWVRYDVGTRELFDESAHLESPQRLQYDAKWPALFEQCRQKGNGTAQPRSGQNGDARPRVPSLKEAVEASPVQALPLAYDYDYITGAPQFVAIPDADLRSLTGGKNLSDGRLRRLPAFGGVQPVLVQGSEPSGESPMYLVTLDAQYRPLAKMVLYEYVPKGDLGVSTVFEIAKDFSITTTQETRTEAGKVSRSSVRKFRIAGDGKIVEGR